MALWWNLQRIQDFRAVCFTTADHDRPDDGVRKGDRILSPLTHCFLFASIAVDLGVISEANVDEWRLRIAVLNRIGASPMLLPDRIPYLPTREEVLRHIGLETNVGSRGRAAFLRKVARVLADDAARAIREADAPNEAPAATQS